MNTRPSEVSPAALSIDHSLAQIEREIEFLLNVTPVNAAEAWADFERNGFSTEPTLLSRPLLFESDLVRRRLYELRLEEIEDPALRELFAEKRDELARGITLLADRDTSRFLYGSLQLFGDVDESLRAEAISLLEGITVEPTRDRRVTAGGFAEAAAAELDHYRSHYEGFDLGLEIRSDVSDLMVSHGRLLIPAQAYFRSGRVEALIQHEVGTHMLTYANGSIQPLKLLAVGLPRYEETQEGLAVLAEYLVGGLDPQRLRLLAARVVAVSRVIEGKGFLDVFEELKDEYEFAPKTAWTITIRVTRAGGMTKDVIYLRGIERVVEFARERRSLEALLVGKLSLDHVPLIEDLLERGVLSRPWLKPRWLDGPFARERLERIYSGIAVRDLLAAEVPR